MAAFRSLCFVLVLVVVLLPFEATGSRSRSRSYWEPLIRSRAEDDEADIELEFEENIGTTWAVVVAGSKGFDNYRHQADVCHAYKILKRGGLKDENIIVFMYDDIANNHLNPTPGFIINRPDGEDVYAGVPKDYTGEQVTAENLFAVLLGDKTSVNGGSRKVVNSTSNDRIFIYYSDHGGPGVLGMPSGPFLYGKDLIEVLKKKHLSKTYKEMVIYIEACESGSVVEGLIPEDLNIYVTTASNAVESSYATYCPGMDPSPPQNFPCLGDLYSVAWMEDSESHNLRKETIQMQFEKVRERTSNHYTYAAGSHVKQYGNKSINAEKLYLYHGYDPATANLPANIAVNGSRHMGVVNQRSADLLFLWKRFEQMEDDSTEKELLLKQIRDIMFHRKHLDSSIEILGALLFDPINSVSVLNHVRDQGQPIVDDWDCLKSMVRIFEKQCGPLMQYGMKHMRAFANICNNGVSESAMEGACGVACGGNDLEDNGNLVLNA